MKQELMTFLKAHWGKILIVILLLLFLSGAVKKAKRRYWRRTASAGGGLFGGLFGGDGGYIGSDQSDPYADALSLYAAMKSPWYNPLEWGTDEETIWLVLQNKTPEQLAAIYNEFNEVLQQNNEDGDLFTWFNDELSSADKARAMGYFDGVSVV